ncbi:hypothetical protein SOVF_065270 isoform B, partial [Spinacia oleracea]
MVGHGPWAYQEFKRFTTPFVAMGISRGILIIGISYEDLEEMYRQGDKAETTWAFTVLGYLGKLIMEILG